jgi:tryptophan 2,3-dioxygenase
MTDDRARALTYSSYLALDEVLAAQRPRSSDHDELLFIVIHQVYELWFKEILHELTFLQERLEAGETAQSLATLKRILTILKTVVAQIDVLETMTPQQFSSFRERLEAASGFQSAQFRELEAMLGRRDPAMLRNYATGTPARARIEAAMSRPALFDSLLRYLTHEGFAAPGEALQRDVSRPWIASAAVQAMLLDVYRASGEAAQVCERFVDFDEGLQEWRYRHVKMVERTIGDKSGTGGSSGSAYLRATLFHPTFPDLWAIRSSL